MSQQPNALSLRQALADAEKPCLIHTTPHKKTCIHCRGTTTVPRWPWARVACPCMSYGLVVCGSCWKGQDNDWEVIHDDDCEHCHGNDYIPADDAHMVVAVLQSVRRVIQVWWTPADALWKCALEHDYTEVGEGETQEVAILAAFGKANGIAVPAERPHA